MTDMNHRPRKAIIILGMHRSGTSALAKVVNLLGVDLGKSFLPPDSANPSGYWEHLHIYDAHEHMLNRLGRVWHSLFPFPEKWWLDPIVDPYRERLIDILRTDFSRSDLWGFKDPRLCRLMPLWHSIFSEVGCEPHFVYVIRNPVEVAESLRRRDGYSWDKCFMLWLLHALDSERECRRYPRVFVTYDRILADWRAVITRISEELRLEWPIRPSIVEKEVSSFLNPDLRHHRSTTSVANRESTLSVLASEMYQVLLDVANGKESLSPEMMSRIEARFEPETAYMSRPILMEELKSLSARLSEAQSWVWPIVQENAQLHRKEDQMNRILQSRSWKITAPLRRVHELIGGEG